MEELYVFIGVLNRIDIDSIDFSRCDNIAIDAITVQQLQEQALWFIATSNWYTLQHRVPRRVWWYTWPILTTAKRLRDSQNPLPYEDSIYDKCLHILGVPIYGDECVRGITLGQTHPCYANATQYRELLQPYSRENMVNIFNIPQSLPLGKNLFAVQQLLLYWWLIFHYKHYDLLGFSSPLLLEEDNPLICC